MGCGNNYKVKQSLISILILIIDHVSQKVMWASQRHTRSVALSREALSILHAITNWKRQKTHELTKGAARHLHKRAR